MKTLTITEGRGRLGYWLKKATQGEDIGFVVDGKVVALRPVEVHSANPISMPVWRSASWGNGSMSVAPAWIGASCSRQRRAF